MGRLKLKRRAPLTRVAAGSTSAILPLRPDLFADRQGCFSARRVVLNVPLSPAGFSSISANMDETRYPLAVFFRDKDKP